MPVPEPPVQVPVPGGRDPRPAAPSSGGTVDAWLLGLAYGTVPPVALFLAGWWLSLPFVPDEYVVAAAGAGLVAGLALDVPLRRWWVRRGYAAGRGVLVALYGFYTVMIFGFFMGVPVPLLGLGVVAGAFAARAHRDVRATAVLSAAATALACCGAAAFAFASPSTPADLEGMLALPFAVTWSMVLGLVVVGGVALVGAQYWLTAASGRWWSRRGW